MFRAALFLCTFLYSVQTIAQQSPVAVPTAAVKDAAAEQLLQQAYAALGGSLLPTVKDLLVQGTVESADGTDMGTLVVKVRGRDFSVETTRKTGTSSYRVLSGRGSVRTGERLIVLPRYNTAGLGVDILPLYARWTDFQKADASIRVTSTRNLDGRQCIEARVKVTDEGLNDHGIIDVCVDSVTGLIASLRYIATEGPFTSSKVQVEYRLHNYRNFGGLMIPAEIERYVQSTKTVVIKVAAVQSNIGFTDQDFRN